MRDQYRFVSKKAMLALGVAALFSGQALAGCPAMFDTTMRQLHSEKQIDLCKLVEDKAVLVINTASHCGFTPQFKGLEALYQQYKDRGLVVVGFPSNDFNQEASKEADTADVCYINYGVNFTMLAPSTIKGPQANKVFQGINRQSPPPAWNFTKYVIDKTGKVTARFQHTVKPNEQTVHQAIQAAL